ncbi:MAG: hypothetical protein HFI67_10645 [Lachnospiraceae bacterium]|nr:hypothetical protein [Lachnospiraceae bacterium]
MKMILMIPAICLMLVLRLEALSASSGSVFVQGLDILSAVNHTVPCGSGTAAYDPDTKTLTLDNAFITGNSGSYYGLEIHETGVTIEVIGENTINAHYGIWSEYPLTIRGTENGSRLLINTIPSPSLPQFACAGIHVRNGGLTVEDIELQLMSGKMSDASAYGIDAWGGDNVINNAKIKITMNPLADPDMQCIGINIPGADSLMVTNNSSITMESLDTGIAFSGNLNISGSSLTIKESARHAVIAGKTEISDGSVLDITAQDGPALSAAGNKVIISGSSVNLESTGTNGIFCQDLEIRDSSRLTAKGYWPALFVDNTTVIQDSSVDTVTENDFGFYCKGSMNISGSKVNSASNLNQSGIRVLGDLTIQDSDIISSGNADNDSISAKGSISITGGTTEIGDGNIFAEKDIYIGGIISSNGVPSYDKIANDSGEVSYLEADYSAVDDSLKKAEALNREDYINFEIVDDAVKTIVRRKPFWEQELVDGYAAAIEEALAALIPASPVEQITYEIIEGAGQTITKGEDDSVTIKSNGDFDKFVSISLNNKEVAKEHYTAAAGSTIITLKPEYIQTLAAETYTVRIHYTDGFAQTILTLQEEEEPEQPSDKPSDKPADKPSDKPSDKPADKPSDKPADKPSDKPNDNSTGSDKAPSSKPQNTEDTKQTSPETGDSLPIIWLFTLAFSYVIIRISRRTGQEK